MKNSCPHNLEAERALIGSILLDNRCFHLAVEQVSMSDFFSEAHRVCFEMIRDMLARNIHVDLVSLNDELERHGLTDKAGGPSSVAALVDGVPIGTDFSVHGYCRIIKEKSALRALLNLSHKIVVEVGGQRESNEILESSESYLAQIRDEQENGVRGALPISEIMHECVPILESTVGRGVMIGTPTGFKELDDLTAGWIPSELVILAARPSEGKTALGLEFLIRAAKSGHSVAVFTLEMSRASLVTRMVCHEAKIDHHRLKKGFLTDGEWDQLIKGFAGLSKLPIWIDDRAGLSANAIRWSIRSLAKRTDLKLVLVDYLQLLRAKAENRTQEVTKISMELQAAARDLGGLTGGTLIAISQLNRIAANERPKLHHLRESGQLEQDADTVIFISDAEQAENGQEEPSIKLIDIAKQRNGPCGSFRLCFLPRWLAFDSECSEEAVPLNRGRGQN